VDQACDGARNRKGNLMQERTRSARVAAGAVPYTPPDEVSGHGASCGTRLWGGVRRRGWLGSPAEPDVTTAVVVAVSTTASVVVIVIARIVPDIQLVSCHIGLLHGLLMSLQVV
jgi:hypothetical protein